MTWLRLIMLGLVTFRLSLMLSKEDGPAWIFRHLRRWVKREAPRETALKKGIECPWCVSVWFGILVAGFERFCAGAPLYEGVILAFSLSALAIIINQTWTKG